MCRSASGPDAREPAVTLTDPQRRVLAYLETVDAAYGSEIGAMLAGPEKAARTSIRGLGGPGGRVASALYRKGLVGMSFSNGDCRYCLTRKGRDTLRSLQEEN